MMTRDAAECLILILNLQGPFYSQANNGIGHNLVMKPILGNFLSNNTLCCLPLKNPSSCPTLSTRVQLLLLQLLKGEGRRTCSIDSVPENVVTMRPWNVVIVLRRDQGYVVVTLFLWQ